MKHEITLVDRGRGLQLSTSRVTVQDLVPYFIEGCTHDEIRRWIPTLSIEEIQVVERYFLEHKAELLEEDRAIRESNACRRNPPEIESIREQGKAKMQSLKEQLSQAKANGAGP